MMVLLAANQNDDFGKFVVCVVVAVILFAMMCRTNYGGTKTPGEVSDVVIEEVFKISGNEFSFRYEELSDGSLQPIAKQYPTNRRSSSPPKCHVYPDGRISIADGRRPNNLDQARAIARYWAKNYLIFLATGTFPDTGESVEV
jgi:hypothetical protein